MKDHADFAAKRVDVPVLKRQTLEQNLALRWRVEPREKFYQRRFSAAIFAHYREALAGSDVQTDIVERWHVATGIEETNVLEANPVFGHGSGKHSAALFRHLVVEVFGEIRQIKIVFIHAVNRSQATGYRALPESKLGDIHRHLPDSNCAGNRGETDPAIGKIERAAGDNAETVAPNPAPQYEAAIFFIDREKNIDIALKEEFA